MSARAVRVAVVSSLVLTSLAAGGAVAAPKAAAPVCNLVVDPKGDDGSEVFKHSDSLDIVSADIASDAKLVTAVIRVAKYAASDSNAAPTGRAWYLEFSLPKAETPLWMGTQVTPTGTLYRYGWVDGTIRRSLGNAEGVIDVAKNELRVSAPIGVWAERGTVKPGSKVSGLVAASYNYVGATAPTGNGGGSLQPGDTAESGKSYVAGAKSCVAPGK